MPTDTTPDTHSQPAGRRFLTVSPLALLLLLIPTASQTQGKSCPRFARVPGYGACTNIGGATCGFCTYRCNDDTVVRWNVCGQ